MTREGTPATAGTGTALQIGVDVGGTFTDVVCVAADGQFWAAKVPSTPGEQHVAVGAGVSRVLDDAAASAADVHRIIHGTTVATNAIIEQKGVATGILMTAGFEDTLEIGRYKRSTNYDVWFDAETPVFLAPRRRRRGIVERVDHRGEVLTELDEDSVRTALTELVEQHAVDAIAVCYLFSFENPAHELRTLEIANELYPSLAVSLSSHVNPEIREYERLCITAFDAYIRPLVGHYLSELRETLERAGVLAPLQVMESRGGIADVRLTLERPSTTIMSGPAAGVIGARDAASRSGHENIISIDIGGTSSDVSLVSEGRPLLSREGKVLTYPVRTPMVDVNSVGAGGGSIAWFDSAGGLHVGPQSAGADPGPACYGRGGAEAAVTDASLVLGYLNPEYFAGGTFSLAPELAHEAIGRVGERLGSSALEAAAGIHRIVNANMTDQIRLISIGRGLDPRKFALVLLGGAGPLHGCELARGLGITTLIVPAVPGVLSAFGLLVGAVEHEQTRTFHVRLATLVAGSDALASFERTFAAMDAEGLEVMMAQQIGAEDVTIRRFVDVRYVGQSYELEVRLDPDLGAFSVDAVAASFEALHLQVYGHARHGEAPEVLNVRTVHVHEAEPLELASRNGRVQTLPDAKKFERDAYFPAHGLVRVDVYERAALPVGARFAGPAIVEQADTTTVVHPGWNVLVDEAAQLVITRPR